MVYSHNSHNLCCFCAGNSAGQCIDYVASSGLNNIPHRCVFTVSTLPPCVCTATVIPLKQPGWDPECFGASPRYVFFLRNPSVIGSSESSTAICVLAHLSIDLNVKICAKTHQDLLWSCETGRAFIFHFKFGVDDNLEKVAKELPAPAPAWIMNAGCAHTYSH